MAEIKLDKKSWEAGYQAGYDRKPNQPTAGLDGLSWSSGYVEGWGDKQNGKPSDLVKRRQREADRGR